MRYDFDGPPHRRGGLAGWRRVVESADAISRELGYTEVAPRAK
jgi:hypothetical protein